MEPSPDTPVNLHGVLNLVHGELTESVCAEVFQKERVTERNRTWSLHLLLTFWSEVIVRAPVSLSEHLKDFWSGRDIRSTDEGFFERCRDLSWKFFAALYRKFVSLVVERAPATFVPELHFLKDSFSNVWILDGSRLDRIARKLKITRHLTCSVLPGCLMAAYDLFRGIAQRLDFDPDAATAEVPRAVRLFSDVPENTLVVGDRAGGIPRMFQTLSQRNLWGLFRRHGHVKLRRIKRLARFLHGDTVVEEFLVKAGDGTTTPVQTLRLIRRRKKKFELLTNVLDPKKLSAVDALKLYRYRWSVEKLFKQLKCVLNLNRFYAANANAIAMQVYTAAIVHTAMRITQARLSQDLQIDPDQLSTDRLFMRLASGSEYLVSHTLTLMEVDELNPGLDYNRPNPERRLTFPLRHILKSRASPHRPAKRRVAKSGNWKSLRHAMESSPLQT